MPERLLPGDWRAWASLAQAALLPGPPIEPAHLLMVMDLEGRAVRPLEPPAGATPRQAAVLLLLYPDGADVRLPLTVRSDRLPSHRGEVALPGGSIDPDDRDAAAAALRECHEELGVDPASVSVWGTLTPLYIPPSNFQITPVVGWSAAPPTLRINLDEVSAVFSVTLGQLLDPATVQTERWRRRDAELLVPFFAVDGHKVWGATALVLSEFAARLRRALGE